MSSTPGDSDGGRSRPVRFGPGPELDPFDAAAAAHRSRPVRLKAGSSEPPLSAPVSFGPSSSRLPKRRRSRAPRTVKTVPHRDWTDYDNDAPPRVRTSLPPPAKEFDPLLPESGTPSPTAHTIDELAASPPTAAEPTPYGRDRATLPKQAAASFHDDASGHAASEHPTAMAPLKRGAAAKGKTLRSTSDQPAPPSDARAAVEAIRRRVREQRLASDQPPTDPAPAAVPDTEALDADTTLRMKRVAVREDKPFHPLEATLPEAGNPAEVSLVQPIDTAGAPTTALSPAPEILAQVDAAHDVGLSPADLSPAEPPAPAPSTSASSTVEPAPAVDLPPIRPKPAMASADASGAFAEVSPFLANRAFPELPKAPKVTARAAPRPDVEAVRLSSQRYRLAIFLPLVGAALVVWYVLTRQVAPTELFAAAAAFVLLSWLAQLWLIYRIWQAIQDGNAPLTPLGASLPLLVPLLNLYWVFRALPGYATAYNAFTARYLLRVPRLSQNLILAAMVVPVVGLGIYWVVVGKLCDAVNAILRAPRSPASVARPELLRR